MYLYVVDYINCWRSLSVDYKDRLSETSRVTMCIQGMHWELLYILQGIKPRTFKELTTWAHDIELSLSSRREKGLPIDKDAKRGDKYSKSTVEESLAITTLQEEHKSTTRKGTASTHLKRDGRKDISFSGLWCFRNTWWPPKKEDN